ncbi:ribosome-associated translation inhibitor RaiA [Bizionia gelidisalsuginis]|uniref:Ribosome-associated translation inhibitor RaiA n=2 Tax=Bizionia TaxID=283785 RepID=A0A8H2LHX5_9FLAO|nr:MULTISPECIES: ribosome-associated translation inhibitor RaiA [Bizionia]TYB76649.1 ribosome-associated translation inhibitor RaiA [Bizionia saleffrena]TYC14158.1 ribosome-associated translation inhibitor RaiA [Bizionia gelidisalsuginis]
MDINFEYHEVNPSESLETFVTEKLNKLFNKYEFIVRADVFFKIQNFSDNTGKIAGIRLSAPGPRLFAEDNSESYHKSVTEAVSQLERQLEKRKGKMKTH